AATRSTRRRPSRPTARRFSTGAPVMRSGRRAGATCTPDGVSPDAAESRLLGATDVRALAAALELRPTKRLGQNFVVDANTVRRIVRTAELDPDDVVVEVGPGLGSLTLALLPVASRVVAVEIDPVLA